jgi:hypothetical protein
MRSRSKSKSAQAQRIEIKEPTRLRVPLAPPPQTRLPEAEVRKILGVQGDAFQSKVVTFSPQDAARVAEGQLGNRPVRRDLVMRFAAVMEREEWVLNGETVKFDARGALHDGQHRLLGCAAAGRSLTTLVVWGVPPEAFDTIDVGARRMFSDILRMRGEVNTATLGASLVLLWRYRNQKLGHRGWDARPEPHAMLALLADEPSIRDAAKVATTLQNHLRLRTSVSATAYHLFKKIDRREAERFIDVMKTGEGARTDPWHKLRERYLVLQREHKRSAAVTLPMLHLAFQAFVAARRGDKDPPLKIQFSPRYSDFPDLRKRS